MTGKTLKELNVQPGDVVEWISQPYFGHMTVIGAKNFETRGVRAVLSKHGAGIFIDELFRIISRASDTPKLWRDMTPEEKGALLLAHHEGEVIEVQKTTGSIWYTATKPIWHSDYAHRIHPEPKGVVVVVAFDRDGYLFTFNRIDGKPDCDSVKMEEL